MHGDPDSMKSVPYAALMSRLRLTALATSAYADCAGVLWLQTSSGWAGDISISPTGATRTQRECEILLRRTATDLGSMGRNKTFNAEGGVVAPWSAPPPRPSGEQPMVALSFSCLPDTVDPCEPKGK